MLGNGKVKSMTDLLREFPQQIYTYIVVSYISPNPQSVSQTFVLTSCATTMSSLLHRYLYSLLSLWSALWLIVECKKDFRWCNRHLPQQGRWVDAPPYWFPYDCPDTRIFDQNSTLHCMKGRTLYVIGNSIARQQAFALLELIGGTAVNRQGQRDMCPKHETFWGDSCHSDFNGVKFKYLFMQFLDGYNYTGE